MTSRDIGVESDGDDGVYAEEEIWSQYSSQGGGEETANGEGDEPIRKHVGGLSAGEVGRFRGVINEETCYCHLSTDVAELGDETEDHVVLFVEWALAGTTGIGVGGLGILDSSFRDLRHLADREKNRDGHTSTGDSQVDELDVGQVIGVLSGEEELGSDQWSNERCNSVPRLAELQTSGCRAGVSDDNSIRVGSSF